MYIPDRASEGYGTNATAFTRLMDEGATLILTVDCGIRSVEDIALAKARGVDCIVIDHHECGELPDTPYILNCKMPGERYPFFDLCGAGTAFKLAQALLGEQAGAFIDLCGVATIGDMVSLRGENRALAYLGLQKLRSAPCLGFEALAAAAGLRLCNISSYGVAFGLAPRVNAAGRLEHASIALELLSTKNRTEAKKLAERLGRSTAAGRNCRRRLRALRRKRCGSKLAWRRRGFYLYLARDGIKESSAWQLPRFLRRFTGRQWCFRKRGNADRLCQEHRRGEPLRGALPGGAFV